MMTETHGGLERIRTYVATRLPLAALFGIEVVAGEPSRAWLVGNARIARPGKSVAGPVLFAIADIAACALTLVQRRPLLA